MIKEGNMSFLKDWALIVSSPLKSGLSHGFNRNQSSQLAFN